jgi:hypothetical protein
MVFLTDEAKHIIEGDHEPASELPASPPSDVDHAVARLIAGEIDDDSCIQIGIGGMPNALCSLLLESGGRNMGVAATARGVYYPSEHQSMVEARAAEFNCRICTAAHESAIGTNRVTPKIFPAHVFAELAQPAASS